MVGVTSRYRRRLETQSPRLPATVHIAPLSAHQGTVIIHVGDVIHTTCPLQAMYNIPYSGGH